MNRRSGLMTLKLRSMHTLPMLLMVSLTMVGGCASDGAILDPPEPAPAAFVFENLTSSPARVSVELKRPLSSSSDEVSKPALSENLRAQAPWRLLKFEDIELNPDRAGFTIVVPPGHSVRLSGLESYAGNNLRGLHFFPISTITVSDDETQTSVRLEGPEALLAFKRWSENLYVFTAYEVRIEKGT